MIGAVRAGCELLQALPGGRYHAAWHATTGSSRYQEAGAEFLEAARARAEEFLQRARQDGRLHPEAGPGRRRRLGRGRPQGYRADPDLHPAGDHRPAVAARSGHQGRSGRPGAPADRRRAGPGRQVEQAAPRRRRRHPRPPPPAARPRRAKKAAGTTAGPRRRRRRRPRPQGAAGEATARRVPGKKAAPAKKAAGRGLSRRRRLDTELVRRQLAASRSQAAELIEARRVLVGGAVAERAARLVDPAEPVTLAGPPPRFVGRGGEKLDAALRHFGLDVGGRRALDAGASTGGFTDCLLQRGADIVVAVDVGHGQLHERLRRDPRVHLAGTDQRPRRPARRARRPTVRCGRGGPVVYLAAHRGDHPGRLTRPAAISSCWSSRNSRPGAARRPEAGGSSATRTCGDRHWQA